MFARTPAQTSWEGLPSGSRHPQRQHKTAPGSRLPPVGATDVGEFLTAASAAKVGAKKQQCRRRYFMSPVRLTRALQIDTGVRLSEVSRL